MHRLLARAAFVLFLGVALCISAIPVIGRILMDLGMAERKVGQLILSYTIIVLVAIVTSVMAAPLLRIAMTRVDAAALQHVATLADDHDHDRPTTAAAE